MLGRLLHRKATRWLLRFEVPSGSPSMPLRRGVRLLALLAVRSQRGYLRDFVSNVAPQVDGIVALDDGSTDGTLEFLESRREVLEVLRVPTDRPYWDEMGNHRALVAAALRHGAEWLISLDADERLEHQFRERAERVIHRGGLLGYSAFCVHLRELWDSPEQYRVDGIWGTKAPARLFKALPDHVFDSRPLHGVKAPLQARIAGRFPIADLNVYHLAMVKPENRAARRRRYELLDPDARWQPRLGYAYLTDERGLTLQTIAPARGYVETARPGAEVSAYPEPLMKGAQTRQ